MVLALVLSLASCSNTRITVCNDERGVRILGVPPAVRVGDEFQVSARLRSCEGEVVTEPVTWNAPGPQLSIDAERGQVVARRSGQAIIEVHIGKGCGEGDDRNCWIRRTIVNVSST
jgi:hypothetical protein